MKTVTREQQLSPPTVLPLVGLEVDNLLAFLALLGLLRAVETSRPEWAPRASWEGPPWRARLHLDRPASEEEVARVAEAGVEAIAARFDVDGRKNVDFDVDDYRAYVLRVREDPVRAALAAALTVEHPRKAQGGLYAAPLVLMFGQGHQNFLDRLMSVTRSRAGDTRSATGGARKVEEALFQPWARTDETDGFRWDPEEDQRYALRFGNPSTAGAAPTVDGANRLAAIGLLSYACMPARRGQRPLAAGVTSEGELAFVWPLWRSALSRIAIERLLSHPHLIDPQPHKLTGLGVVELYRARRVSNGKFMNITRAVPVRT
jgi:hypothetical protein